MADMIDQNDKRKRHCPMLGHELHFSYCRSPGSDLPCRKIFDCWFRVFDVEGFMRQHFSQEDIEKILSPRSDKAVTLAELIDKARKRAKQEEHETPDKQD